MQSRIRKKDITDSPTTLLKQSGNALIIKTNKMAIDTQEVLYIQALDNYPFDIEQCIEKLQYVIGANNTHVGAHYLMGRIYMEQLDDYKNAKFYFQMALHLDHTFTPTYYYYAELLILLNNYQEAERVLDIGITIPGSDKASLEFLKGILFEKYEMYTTAKKCFKAAKRSALNTNFRSFLDKEIDRVTSKKEEVKKASKSKKKKKNKK
ncbi:tetratricopeptide repeat protein [Aquimarina algiphila]|uniref:Tetratricopeptide repeat protein n=2 Tax=Flavobacteriaceae TaxID=49546 RepID=A0A554VD22_9FLAO|nr:tetratricopeptide repeat protein [Aquimarina algiphila]